MTIEDLINNPPPVDITVGAWYTLRLPGETPRVIRMQAVKVYPCYVLFRDERGIRECWTWWELRRMMR